MRLSLNIISPAERTPLSLSVHLKALTYFLFSCSQNLSSSSEVPSKLLNNSITFLQSGPRRRKEAREQPEGLKAIHYSESPSVRRPFRSLCFDVPLQAHSRVRYSSTASSASDLQHSEQLTPIFCSEGLAV